jgi:hypothetical protein
MVSTMANDDTIRKYWALSDTLIHMSCLVLGRGYKPWIITVLAVVMVLCAHTNPNDMARAYLLYLLKCAMVVFTCNKSRLRWPTAVQGSPRTSSGFLVLSHDLQELVRISTLLLSAGSFVLWVWFGLKFSGPSLSQLSYLVLLPLCLAQAASIYIRRLRRSVEFSYDQEAQDTVETLGALPWLKSLRMDPGVARSKQGYIELVVEALLITIYLSI